MKNIDRLARTSGIAAAVFLTACTANARFHHASTCSPACGPGTECAPSGECVATTSSPDAGVVGTDAGFVTSSAPDAWSGSTGGGGGGGGGTPDAWSGSTGGGGGTGSGAYCAACTSSADCGGGNNFCLGFSFGDYCGTDCSAGQACPPNAECQPIGDGSGATVGMNCVPATGLTCSSGGGGGTGGGGTPDAGSAPCTTDTYAGWPGTFFTDHCRRCHTSEFTASDARSRASTISSYISSGSMPRGETLSSADRSRILAWLACGAP